MQEKFEDVTESSVPRLRLKLLQDFAAPKKGRAESEYEDAGKASPYCLAAADGASESSFAGIWARDLVSEFVASPPDKATLVNWLEPLQNKWSAIVGAMTLPWYAEEKAQYGAFAALAGVKLTGGENWSALAVGDTCVFLVREDRLSLAFPLHHSEEFGNTPELISSNAAKNRNISAFIREVSETCDTGDLFLLATDALACWFLKAVEAGTEPWRMLLSLENHEAFLRFLDEERTERRMRNDDVTLLTARVTSESDDDTPDVA